MLPGLNVSGDFRARCLLVAFIVVLVGPGCSTVRSASDYDTTAKFYSYTTFTFMERQRGGTEDPQVLRKVEDDIRARLEAKGYQSASNPASADFIVDFTVGAGDRIDLNAYPAPYAGGWFWDAGLRGGPYWGRQIDAAAYRPGILSIDLFDASTHRPVWHGC
jgi:hypothetical protein